MRTITLLLLLVGITGVAQIKGNKNIQTRTFSAENIKEIKINFYAQVIIDQSLEESITITTDSNLFNLISKDVDNGILHLDQKEWIQPSENAKITIGAPNLRKVESGTHDTTRVINVDNEYLQILAPVGNIILDGKTKELIIGAELATIEASGLIAEDARIKIWSRGSARVFVTNELDAKLDEDARLTVVNTPKILKGDSKKALDNKEEKLDASVKFIKFKIKNNSFTRNQFLVIGPKSDGTTFSYGFPMMPQATRKENWSNGTKVYKVSKLGKRKLLTTIKLSDEGKVVSLF